jgi:hypothetical protein
MGQPAAIAQGAGEVHALRMQLAALWGFLLLCVLLWFASPALALALYAFGGLVFAVKR